MTDELAAHPPEPARGADFLADFAVLSGIGATPGGGVERQAGTAEDGQMRDWFTRWLRDRGFDVRVDPVGNLIGLRELVAGAPYIVVGSHLDSQPMAGKYDGAYGVLAGAHAVHRVSEALRASGAEPRFNLAVVDWFNEEGSRFKPSLMGSGVQAGVLPLGQALATRDRRGISVREALAVVPTLLFFVPSVDGISHSEREFTRDEDLIAGLAVMTGVLDRLARHGFSY